MPLCCRERSLNSSSGLSNQRKPATEPSRQDAGAEHPRQFVGGLCNDAYRPIRRLTVVIVQVRQQLDYGPPANTGGGYGFDADVPAAGSPAPAASTRRCDVDRALGAGLSRRRVAATTSFVLRTRVPERRAPCWRRHPRWPRRAHSDVIPICRVKRPRRAVVRARCSILAHRAPIADSGALPEPGQNHGSARDGTIWVWFGRRFHSPLSVAESRQLFVNLQVSDAVAP